MPLIKKGFTLSETLTVLMIIGVIAAITIPLLNSNVEKQKKLTMLKKLYSSFGVNIQTVLNEASCSSLSCLRKWGKSTNIDGDEISKGIHNGVLANPTYFNIDSKCTNCFQKGSIMPIEEMSAGDLETENNTEDPSNNKTDNNEENNQTANFSAYVLKNMSYMGIYDFEDNCSKKLDNVQINNEAIDLCGIVVFDVNGYKGPNQPGEDRFAYFITDEPIDNSYLLPVGYKATDKDNSSQFNKQGEIISTVGDGNCTPYKLEGYNCTAKIMLDGWKMEY